ncbi:biotin/lipoyl-binding protein [Desulfuromonas acetoxidans]|uniref:Biotin/lipoyl attachment n=1 Tax=Desulfuromonas acetoxidans (strain DSM 684 / 11070) TaxID=281689 RepID=Q1K2T5_DESA6|nr:biotin/lipoyl-containing protein [Desulfuromonas acetoxidans]EAT16796.1 biotin/lipoyl attachment [Desulfuromonas acetoxidans DSM 684]MBF0644656.1 biotin/lipoyl-binding protein [Desulfuromonas acetoxidans]NVD23737.1 biotin/lipoyl-binding protein [Desulfuromonas acetoxidans]NVE15866.1 biotin/lipoyl-binding protein [Desulfuromonas acetoxidans]
MRKYQLTINKKSITVNLKELTAEAAEVEVNGTRYQVTIEDIHQDEETMTGPTSRSLTRPVNAVTPSAQTSPTQGDQSGSVCAPIPGSIIAVLVKTGDEVQAGQPLFKMEAMKMENEINSRVNGTVAAIHVQQGDSVAQGQEILLIEVKPPRRRQSDLKD